MAERSRAPLAGTAFTGAFIAVIAAHPQSALAQCAITATSIDCATNTTTTDTVNTVGPNPSPTSSSAQQNFTTTQDTITATVQGGVTVNGFGLQISAFPGNDNLNLINNGTVKYDDPTSRFDAALSAIVFNSGNVTYTGNGAVINSTNGPIAGGLSLTSQNHVTLGTFSARVTGTFIAGDSGAAIGVEAGGLEPASSASVFLKGGIVTGGVGISAFGLSLQTPTTVIVDTTGGTVVSASLVGIEARVQFGGTMRVTTDAMIGTPAARVGTGLEVMDFAPFQPASATVNQTGGAIYFNQFGILAAIGGNGDVTVTTAAGSSLDGPGTASGTAVNANTAGIRNVTVTAAGAITNAATGINAAISNTANGNNVIVTQSGTVSAGTGIVATTAGTGAVAVNVLGPVTATISDGIDATATSGPIAITASAPISATATAISLTGGRANTITTGAPLIGTTGVKTTGGTTTLDNFASITGSGGSAVQFGGANNLLIMDGPGATLSGKAIGSGSDTFRFAGGGTNAFDVSQIGSGWTLLDKQGSSNWTLTGVATYTGPVTVSAGTLSVNGFLASAASLTVAPGATLGGNGTVPSTIVSSGGTLSPGNSIGTLTVVGTLVLGAGAIYKVEVSSSGADRTNVAGSANIAGSTLNLVPTGSISFGTPYTLIGASAGLSGTFASVTSSLGSTIRPSLTYDANDAFLTLFPVGVTPSIVNGTLNQLRVGGAIDATFAANQIPPVFLSVFNLAPAQLNGALNALSGEVHASVAGLLADESLYARSAILSRLRQTSYGGEAMASMAALRLGGPQSFAGADEISSVLAYAKSPIVTKAPIKPMAATPDVVFWAQGFSAWGRFDGDGNGTSVRRDLAGFITGVDTRVTANGRVGFAAGYAGSQSNLDGRGSASVETGHVAAYGGWSLGALNLRGGGAYAFHAIDTDRTIAFPGVFDRAVAHYDGGTGQIFGEAGYGFAFANLAIEPFAGGAWVRVQTDGTVERAMLAGLNIARTSFEVGYSTLGIRAASLVPLDHGMVLIPRAFVAWQHAFSDVTPTDVLAFQVAPTVPFTIAGVPIARDAALLEAGFDLALNAHATVGVSYTGQIASNVQDHAAKGKFSWKF